MKGEAMAEHGSRVALLVAAIVVVVIAVLEFRKKKELADSTVAQIEGAIAQLDPATRAAVVSRLAADEARYVQARAGGTD